LSDEKKLSVALSHRADDAVFCHQALELITGVQCRDWNHATARPPCRVAQIAIMRASVTSCALIVTLIDQLTTRR
jgi:hypothetical protein